MAEVCDSAHDSYDPKTHYSHDDTCYGVPFKYAFNIGEDIKEDDPLIAKDKCTTTYGDDKKPMTGPAAGFQTDGGKDFNCRIAGSVHTDGNVRVGLIDDADPTAGYYFTVAG